MAQSTSEIKHVLLISVDGMHALDLANCSKGLGTIKGGDPYAPISPDYPSGAWITCQHQPPSPQTPSLD